MSEFVVKDSGKRVDFPSGMRRDVDEDKPIYTLIDRAFLKRIALHLAKGAKKYGRNNWQLANSAEELQRFEDSAFRHLIQWLDGEEDEDHVAAIVFNLMCAEYVKRKMRRERTTNVNHG